MQILLLIVFSLQAWLCWSTMRRFWLGGSAGDALVRLAFATGAWAGLLSLGSLAARRMDLHSEGSVWGAHLLVLGAAWTWVWVLSKVSAPRSGPARQQEARPARWVETAYVVLGSVPAMFYVVHGILFSRRWPNSMDDAIWMYNTKAALLHLHDGPWAAFIDSLSLTGHADYPLLLSGFIAAGMDLADSSGVAAPIVTTMMFAVAILLLVVGTLGAMRSWPIAAIGCATLVSHPRFAHFASSQHADVPLAFYVAAGAMLLRRGVTRQDNALGRSSGRFNPSLW